MSAIAMALCALLALCSCQRVEIPANQPVEAVPNEISHYTCPMHPAVHADHSGQCLICGMDLVAVSGREAESGVVRVDPERLQKLGVRFAEAARAPLVRSLRAVGRVDERGQVDVQLDRADLRLVSPGQRATVRAADLPGRDLAARVASAAASNVRLSLGKGAVGLRPGTWVDVALRVDLGERLLVPSSAVIFAGERRVVFVDLGAGRLEPRSVGVGLAGGDDVEITTGLAPGERVVASGNFLIAAESRIQSALEQW